MVMTEETNFIKDLAFEAENSVATVEEACEVVSQWLKDFDWDNI